MSVYRPKYQDPKTGKLKQQAVWWYEFTFAGKRIRDSAKTTRKTIAVAAEKQRRLELERSLAGMPAEKHQNRIRTVAEVLGEYRKTYPVNHRDKSVAIVKERSAHLDRLLGAVLLPDLSPERITGYMAQRLEEQASNRKQASNRTINMEVDCLARAMGHQWRELWPKVRRLEENHDVGQALEAEQEAAVLKAAAANRSKMLYPFLMALTWTGIRSDEARRLRWSQVDFEAGHVLVRKSKTEAGKWRVIPMSGALKMAMEQHAAWCARKLGPIQPNWYVFPWSNRTKPVDPTRPVTSFKKGWESVRDEAGVTCRLHDLRHSFCTKLGEADVPESTMLDMMGHVSASMLRRYSHIRVQARKDAIAALEARARSVGVPKESPKVEESKLGKIPVTH
jgi:integrase